VTVGPIISLDLDALHTAIVDRLAAQFPAMQTVAAYPGDRTTLRAPAILVELEDFEGAPDDNPGTEQLPVVARFSARIVIGFRTANAKREIRKLAAAVGVFVHRNRWGQHVGPAEVLTITPDDFEPALDQFEVWRVEWQQPLALGAGVWTNDGSIPTEVLFSVVPDIGPPNVDEYEPVDLSSPLGPEL
jgi:hypothetical protein